MSVGFHGPANMSGKLDRFIICNEHNYVFYMLTSLLYSIFLVT